MRPYYQRAGITIYHARCEDVLPLLECVDHVITDPPYSEHVHSKSLRGASAYDDVRYNGTGAHPSSYGRKRELGFEALTPELRTFCAEQFARLVRRWVLVFSDVESCHLWRADLVKAGLEYIRTGEWRKVNGAPQFTGDRPAPGFETITIAHPGGRKRWHGGGQTASWAYPVVKNRGGKTPRLHTTQKPLELMQQLVALFTDPGETILDAFGGSGTTALACKNLGRSCIVIERDERYCERTAKRLQQEVLPYEVFEPVAEPAQPRGGGRV